MVPRDLDRLIEKYLAGTCTEAERHVVESLYASLGKKALSDDLPEDDEPRARRILDRIQAHTRAVDTEDHHRNYFWRYAGIAASLLVLLLAGFYFSNGDATIRTTATVEEAAEAFTVVENPTPTLKRVILPDGSIVQMSSESRIRYAPQDAGPARELFLEGEAYFDVAHNNARPFYVYAGNVVTRVLGTSFSVHARGKDDKVIVSVRTGKVSVYSRKASHKKTVITPNQEAVYDNATDLVATKTALPERSDKDKTPSGEMHFEETPVSQVLSMLSKTYLIDIVFDETSLSGCVLTSSFYDEGLYDRIDVICTAIGATYSIVDARIFIESKGCNLKSESL